MNPRLHSLILVVLLTCQNISCSPTSSSVIIVGAGASGIAAASKLLENGITNITILEAERRIGGRIHTVDFGGGLVDVGAEFVQNLDGNLVYDIVKKYNILYSFNFDYLEFYKSNKEDVDDQFVKKLFDVAIKILFGVREAPEGLTLGEYNMKLFNESISKFQLTDAKKINFANEFVDFFHHFTLCDKGAKTWDDVSAKSDYDVLGDSYLGFNGHGFKTILDIMMKKYPKTNALMPIDDKILLNKVVTKILWDKVDGVTVKCSDGTAYHSNYVVFTPSLGVMKKLHSDLFEPRLPQQKINAIEKLGTGPMMKVALHYRKPWWPKTKFSGVNMIWTNDNKKAMRAVGKEWLLDLVGLSPIDEVPNVLMAWMSGANTEFTELLDEESFKDGLVIALKTFLEPKYQITPPDAILRSNWYTNPHFYGTYVYETPASRRDKKQGVDHIQELRKPLRNTNSKDSVFFAGDSTHPTKYGSVDGAIATGYSVAQKLYKLLTEKNGDFLMFSMRL